MNIVQMHFHYLKLVWEISYGKMDWGKEVIQLPHQMISLNPSPIWGQWHALICLNYGFYQIQSNIKRKYLISYAALTKKNYDTLLIYVMAKPWPHKNDRCH